MSEVRTASLGCRNESEETSVQTVCRAATKRKNIHCIACLVIAVCLCASMIGAQDQTKFSAEQEVLNAMRVRVEADTRHDGSLARYIADDCIFTDDIGRVFTKAQFLNDNSPPEYDQVGNRRNFIVHVHGNEAVLNYQATEHERYGDADVITELRVTESYVKQNGVWLLTAKQWGVVPVNLRKPLAGETRVFRDYVGDYEWRPVVEVETTSVKDGRLWSNIGSFEEEWFPMGADTFFKKSDFSTYTFVRDGQGRVSGFTYHRYDGQEIHVKKIK